MVEFGVSLVSEGGCEASVRHAVRAEKAGLDYVFMSDHFKGGNVYICLTSIAHRTRKIRLGPGVTNPYLIHPVVTAQMLSSISEVAPSRVVCGIGAGDESSLRRVGVKQIRPLAAVREAVYIIRALLSGEAVELDGEVFKISGVKLSLPRVSPIPIFIGAQGERMLKLAGEVGDGVLINSSDPKECRWAVEAVKKGAEDAGRDVDELELAAFTPFSVAERPEDALKTVVPKVAVVASGCGESALMRLGIPLSDWKRVRRAVMRGDRGEMERAVTPRMIEAFSICGIPNTCIGRIEELIKTGLDLIVLSPPLGPDEDWAIDWISRDVLPRFRGL